MVSNDYVAIIEKDPFNRMHERNAYNTPHHQFNCGGYALGTFSWYVPRFEGDDFYFSFEDEQENAEKLAYCIEVMIQEVGGLRRINNLKELQKDEYAIAFRLTDTESETDFHFMRRARNGCWYQKQGGTKGIKRVPKEKVFSEVWEADMWYWYTGEIALLAKKR